LNSSKEYKWYTQDSKAFLERDYLLPGQTLDERVTIICNKAEKTLGIVGFAERFKANLKAGWYSLSTPIWTNYGTDRGLPISCFGSSLSDDIGSILYTQAEVGAMTKYGGGTSAYFGNLRPRGAKIRNNGESSGSVHFMQLFENIIKVVSQGGTRRGNFAAYLPADHGDIMEFLTIRKEGSPLQDISTGVTVSDGFMHRMIARDPEAGKVWAKVIESRSNVGYPYILFTGNANKGAADVYRDKGMEIVNSNLCTEIMEPTSEEEAFVCCLMSMNILHYDAWKNTDAVQLAIYFLDTVMTEFLEKASKVRFLERAVRFAERHRALGLGWLGWHSYLQSKMIPFESMEAKYLNVEIAQTMRKQAYDASGELATMFGEPHYLQGYGRRNTTLLAIAPTKSSAFILGQVSEGIEPIRSNYFINDLAKGKFSYRNPYLLALLESKGQNTPEVWDSILKQSGSVQHLEFLSPEEKTVFKTFSEISQREIIIQASQRQKYIDQGQSLNLMIHPSAPAKEVNALYILAWELGIKSLYYSIGFSAAREFSQSLTDCVSCSA
jgi:ribonucleoside-diphosphate reductase alpha chain